MSLQRESTIKTAGGYKNGDMKLAGYPITFTANAITEPANDPGYYLLNGCILAQATYPTLFARFGTTFNTGGEGVGNFRLPDLTDGKTPIPKGLSTFTTFGASGGEINHTLSSGEMPVHAHSDTFGISAGSHSHTGSGSITSSPGDHNHSATFIAGSSSGSSTGGVAIYTSGFQAAASGAGGNHSHSISISVGSSGTGSLTVSGAISSAGSGSAHNNMPPYVIVGGWLVKYG